MSGTNVVGVFSVVYFSRPAQDTDLRRLLHSLGAALGRRSRKLHFKSHMPGRFLEFEAPGLTGSLILSERPLGHAIWNAHAETREGAAAMALRRALDAHKAHLHICVEGELADTALRAILRATFGVCAQAAPIAVWHGQEKSLFAPAEAADFLEISLPTPRDTAAAARAHVVRPRRVTLPAGRPLRQRPGISTGPTARPALPLLQRLLGQARAHMPISPATATRISAGIVFGMLISGWVQFTVAPEAAMATTQPQPVTLALDVGSHKCGSKTRPIGCAANE